MQKKKKAESSGKGSLHPRNRHQGRYDLEKLTAAHPELGDFVHLNEYGNHSIDFFDPKAVLSLNRALLFQYYGITQWDIPANYLCPSIPGRADYIHYMADVLADAHESNIPTGTHVSCLDIGVGASCVYPIIGRSEYGWSFISNSLLGEHVHIRQQTRAEDILLGVLKKNELIDLLICNPPFHASAEEARASSMRKLRNLKGKKVSTPVLNFGGQANELWTEGGEKKFILRLIKESAQYAKTCFCFSTLVSKASNVKPLLKAISKSGAAESAVITMGKGNKVSRIVWWSFLTVAEKKKWSSAQNK
jgi:23S rRNA (adenine1618-N6)-methyltransferase